MSCPYHTEKKARCYYCDNPPSKLDRYLDSGGEMLYGLAGIVIMVMLIGFFADGSSGTTCSDGWVSHSSGSGTCSWHGGE